MFEAKLENGSMWRKIVEAVNKDIIENAIFDCSGEGIKLQGMDSSHICLVHLELHKDGFGEKCYRCDRNIALGVKVENLLKLLRCAGPNDAITFRADENGGDTLVLIFESPSPNDDDKSVITKISKYEMKLIDLDQEHLGIPDQDFSCSVKMPSGEFSRICRDLSQIGDTVIVTCAKDGITFSCSGDVGMGQVTLQQTANMDMKEKDQVEIEMKEAVNLNFSLRFLTMFSKAAPLASRVKLNLAPAIPLVAEYEIEDVEGLGKIRYYLAPKLDEEDS